MADSGPALSGERYFVICDLQQPVFHPACVSFAGGVERSLLSRIASLLGLILQLVYYTWCYARFVDPAPARARWLKATGVSSISVLSWTLLSMLAMSLYMYRGRDFYKFFVRMDG